MNTHFCAQLALATALGISGTAHAALQGRDLNGSAGSFEAYYDTELNITWLANANVNGQMTWAAANTWAANLSIVDAVNNITYDNWRLPTTLQPDASCGIQPGPGTSYGWGCSGSEMGHLFYSELGGTAGQSILTSADADMAKFSNLKADRYWSSTAYVPSAGYAWNFYFDNGYQGANLDTIERYALAVSPGDVAAIPEAETYAMMLAGLGLIGWRVRRRE